MSRLRVAICHPLQGRGGSEARALWAAQALRDEYDVALVTAGPVDLAELDAACGTSLTGSGVGISAAKSVAMLRLLRGGDALRGAFFQRHCQDIANGFDVLLSAYNLIDCGRPAIHCVADFSWDEEVRRAHDASPSGVRGWFHHHAFLRRPYLALTRAIARRSGRDIFSGEDLILANSRWTAEVMRERWGVEAPVLYPPVLGAFPHVEWEDRLPDFVCLGRVSPEKRIEQVVGIIRDVREHGHDVRLRIVGDVMATPYGHEIQSLCRDAGEWAVCDGRVDGERKASLLASCRYGIHACRPEAFGIAVAEMVKAGCLPFVPSEGGPVGIVGRVDLTFSSVDEAVTKICAVLDKPEREKRVRAHLARQAERFGTERFCEQLRGYVQAFVEGSTSRPGLVR